MRPKQVFVATVVVLLTIAGAMILLRLLEIIVLFFLAFIFASAVSPLVLRFHRRLSLGMSIAAVYLIFALLLAVILGILVPPLVSQTTKLVQNAPSLMSAANQQLIAVQRLLRLPHGAGTIDFSRAYTEVAQRAPSLVAGVLNVTLTVVSLVASAVAMLVMAFYWLLERHTVESTWFGLLSVAKRGEARMILEEIEIKLGGYVRGQLILAGIVGVLALIGLELLRVPYALVLALFSGLAELIPLLGPFIGATPAVLVAFSKSPQHAVFVVLLYIGIQELEGHILVPKVMSTTVGLSPLTVLLAVLSGAALFGVLGALLAVPVASMIHVILRHTVLRPKPEYVEPPVV